MYKNLLRCRACGYGQPIQADGIKIQQSTDRLVPVFDLGIQPLANDFAKDAEPRAGFYPLKVLLCPKCNLAQLSATVDPETLYRNYRYVTSPSETMQRHFNLLRVLIKEEAPVAKRVFEIGSNDGLLLEHFERHGWEVSGVDPAENLCRKAHERGVHVFCDFFGTKFAEKRFPNEPVPEVILARHVFCHCDDWKDFVKGLEMICGKETLICIEVPYVVDLLAKGEFDTIYHEHLSYLNVAGISSLVKDSALRLHRIIPMAIHGGALLIMLRHRDSVRAPEKSVTETLINEHCDENEWRAFAVKCHAKIGALQAFVDQAVTNGKTVIGLGASAKSTVWVNACKFGRKQISFITDTTAEKLWRLSPGTDIPIVDEGALLREQPDYAIVFAWNYLEEIKEKHAAYLKAGGKFVVPHPEIKIVDQ